MRTENDSAVVCSEILQENVAEEYGDLRERDPYDNNTCLTIQFLILMTSTHRSFKREDFES